MEPTGARTAEPRASAGAHAADKEVHVCVERAGRPRLISDPLDVTHTTLHGRGIANEIASMTPKALLDEILRLPVEERLRLVEDIWDSIAATPAAVPVPEWHKAELDRRLNEPEPGPSLTWEEVRDKLRGRGSG